MRGALKRITLILQASGGGGSKGMGFLGWIVLGLVAGAIAKLIMPGDDPGGA